MEKSVIDLQAKYGGSKEPWGLAINEVGEWATFRFSDGSKGEGGAGRIRAQETWDTQALGKWPRYGTEKSVVCI